MSMVSTSRTQRRDKPSNAIHKVAHASAEEIRLAQIIGNTGQEEDVEIKKNVAKVIEVTGTTEEYARIALYDSNNDTSRAIELILETNSLEQTNEWETACRRKNKQSQNVRGVDTYDDEIRDTVPQSDNFDKPSSKGRGRGRNIKGRGKNSDPDRLNDRDGKDGSESRDRSQKDRRGRGRGFGRGNRRGGGPPRRFGRFNQTKGDGYSKDQSSDDRNDFGGKFGTFTTTTTNHTSDAWDADEDWGNLEVGTWSNDDAQKQSEKKSGPANDAWGGSGNWNDDPVETQVFQSQNAQQIPSTMPAPPNHTSGNNGPQMGERIDLGTLFKKSNNDSSSAYSQQMSNDGLISQTGMVFNNSGSAQHPTPSVIQQLQQQGQSSSLFSDTKMVNDIDSKSRLFGAYERQGNTTTPSNVTDVGPYTTESSYSQFNEKLMSENAEGSASLLGTFGEQFKPSTEPSMRLGQMPELTKSPYTPLSQTDSSNPVSAPTGYRTFSEVQQREATEAVKASLGLPPATEPIPPVASGSTNLNQTESIVPQSTLSFGAPQSARMKQQRRKMPTVSSKIPSSAVEMPGAGGGTFHELTNLQFGTDDSVTTVTTKDFATANGTMMDSTLASTQTSMYNSNVMTSPASLINHMTSGNLEDTSIFSSQLSNQKPQTINHVEATMKATEANNSAPPPQQRYPEPMKSTETTLRGPPGITHPQSIATSTSPPGGNLGVLSGTDLSSSGGSYGSGRLAASGNMPLSGMSHETTNDASQTLSNPMHSYYSSSSLNQQAQHMASDHSNSAGRSLRSPVPSTQTSHTGTPSKDVNNAAATSISSLTGSLAQTHMTSHVGGTPTKIQATTASAPINILGTSDSNTSLGAANAPYGSISLGYNASTAPSVSSQSSTPAGASPGKHMTESDLYTSSGLSSIHHNHQPVSTSSITSNSLSSVLSLPSASTVKSSALTSTASKTGPPNLTLGVPPLLPNQYGIPMAPGLMPAYTPEALYGYDPLVAVQSRVHQMPNYYDMYSNANPTNSSTVNREVSTTTAGQGKFGRGDQSSPTSLIGVVNSAGANLTQQQLASGQHSTQIKVSQSGAHQAQPFVNLPTATPAAAYAGYGAAGLYYNAFQYPPTMFAAAATAVPSAKHQGNTTAPAFQQPATAFANAYSTSSINASTASNLHDLQGQGYNKSHVPGYDKQTFHHHTNTPPPFNIQTLTAAMAAANSGAAAGAAPAMNPYTQAPFMTVLPTHQHSQIHLHLPQHGDAGTTVGSQRSQDSNSMGKGGNKGLFGNNTQYWGN